MSNARDVARTRVAPAVCEIRLLATMAELVESYRFRYAVYGDLGFIRQPNRSKLEIDAYDRFAIPFGAFDPDSGALVGTLRLVGSEAHPVYEGAIRRVLDRHEDRALTDQATRSRPHALPSIISPYIAQQIETFDSGRFPVRELSRTIVCPEQRGVGISRGLLEFGLAYASRLGPAVLIGSCSSEHVPMYARYGYTRLPETSLDRYDSVGQIGNAVICRTDVLPHPTRLHVDELVHHMRSGSNTCVLEIGPDAHAIHRFTPACLQESE